MKEHIFAGAYWPARKESRTACAQRIAKFLNSIIDQPLLSTWYFRGHSRKNAIKPLEVSLETLEKNLMTNNRDDNQLPITELGFSLGLWNGNDLFPAGFDVNCGSFSKRITNCAVITFPMQDPPEDEESIKYYKKLLEKLIQAWDPECATITSNEFLERAGGGMPYDKGGWLTYRCRKGIKVKI